MSATLSAGGRASASEVRSRPSTAVRRGWIKRPSRFRSTPCGGGGPAGPVSESTQRHRGHAHGRTVKILNSSRAVASGASADGYAVADNAADPESDDRSGAEPSRHQTLTGRLDCQTRCPPQNHEPERPAVGAASHGAFQRQTQSGESHSRIIADLPPCHAHHHPARRLQAPVPRPIALEGRSGLVEGATVELDDHALRRQTQPHSNRAPTTSTSALSSGRSTDGTISLTKIASSSLRVTP